MSTSSYKTEEMEQGLDKMTVVQGCLATLSKNGTSASKGREMLKRLCYLMYTGEKFSEDEATQLFFTIIKLFHKESPGLRQIIYLAVKELTAFTDNVIMVTATIMKDVQGGQGQLYRPDAIRALAKIVDAASVESTDRPIRNAIVDKDGSVSSAALVCAYHLWALSKDTVRRWATETQEALVSPKSYMLSTGGPITGASAITQYHALGLLYHMRAHDRVALTKLIQQLGTSQTSLRSPHALVLLVKYTGQLMVDDPRLRPTLMAYLQGWLRHVSDMVNMEAAKTILALADVSADEAQSAILALQQFLASPRAPTRFAAIRLLNRYAAINSQAVSHCNYEIEHLITDPNRSIATYAITALLKTGREESVDRLIEQISSLMEDIGDDFRIIVVDAIRSLALKFPSKHVAMLEFFAKELRNDGSLPLKTSVVESLFDIIRVSPQIRDDALAHLCEFIEDCEYPELTARVLHLLGNIGGEASNPSQYVRYVHNRVVLENSVVRAAAVSALTKLALVPSLSKSVGVLLKQCLTDQTDEVRDRAAFGLATITRPEDAAAFLTPNKKLALPQLENALVMYVSDSGNFDSPFDASSIPRVTEEQRNAERRQAKQTPIERSEPAPTAPAASSSSSASASGAAAAKSAATALEPANDAKYAQELSAVAEFEPFGKLLRSSVPQQLTESEMEYVVEAIVHVFESHLIVQLNINNTYELELENVRAEFDLEELEESLQEELFVPLTSLAPNSQGKLYVAFERAEGLICGSLPSKLHFTIDGTEEEYGMDALELIPAHFIEPTYVGSFTHKWDELPGEDVGTHQLAQCKSLESAVEYLGKRLGMMSHDSTDIVEKGETSHTLKLFGRVLGKEPIAAVCRLVSARSGIVGKVTIRSNDQDTAELVSNAIS